MGDHRGIDDDFSLTDLPDPAADRPVVTGVSVAVGRWFDVSTLVVRIAFVLMSLASGLGVAMYLAAWLALGRGRRWVPVESLPSGRSDSHDPRRNLGFGLLVLAVTVGAIQSGWASPAMWPAAIVAAGVAVAWRGGTEVGSELARQVAGMVLVLVGMGVLLFSQFSFAALRDGIVAGLIVMTGLALVLGPWMLRSTRTALEERRERVRSEERAEVAEHLHDSVLQTLTLIQKRAAGSGDPDAREIATLARRQERELRRWLYGRSDTSASAQFRTTVESLVADVEDLHGITIEAVVVGDAPMDAGMDALTAAMREALVNAAKFSGMTEVSLFVEVAGDSVTAFVRDRGVGFDPGVVPEDRHGIRDSIVGRIRRHGGEAEVRSSPGEGTEVRISLARHPEPADDARSESKSADRSTS